MAIELQSPQPLRRTARHARPVEPRTHKNKNFNLDWIWNMLTWIRNLNWNWLTAGRIGNFIKEEKITIIGVFLITPILAFAFAMAYAGLQALIGTPLPVSDLLTLGNLADAAMETVRDKTGEQPSATSIGMSMFHKPPC